VSGVCGKLESLEAGEEDGQGTDENQGSRKQNDACGGAGDVISDNEG
jgi:hypothetical protein